VRIAALTNSNADFLTYLNSKDLHLGVQVNILNVETFDRSMNVSYEGHKKEVLSKIVSDRLLVEIV